MSDNVGSVTTWIGQLKYGDRQAAELLCNRYFDQLAKLARSRLGRAPRRVADEEDVAVGVLHELFEGIRENQFPDLTDREGLWSLLTVMTHRKAARQIKTEFRDKRGGGKVGGESVFLQLGLESEDGGIGQVVGTEPTPEFVVEMSENCEHLFERLGDDTLREIARLRMQGYEVKEIAEKLGVAERSIGRKLALIRDIWRDEMGEE